MNRIIQLILFVILIFFTLVFYNVYLADNKKISSVNNLSSNTILEQTGNNLIKNLKYEVNLDQDNRYIITAELSEITYENDNELVKMQKVIAIFIDGNNMPITVTSDKALFNSTDYDTKFRDNVIIEYIDNIIFADKMDLDFKNNIITVFDNVKYDGIQGNLSADNIKVNLISKKIDIYMNNNKDNVEIISR